MADIVFINPRFEISYWGMEHALPLTGKRANMPVACLPLLAALTPAGHTVTLIDENVEAIDWDRVARADIVGVTGMSVQRRRMQEILTELKQRGVFTVVGGPWVTVQEDYFGELADVIFVGEAEETWPRFLGEWQRGQHQQRYEQAEKSDMTKLPVPRFDLLKMHHYLFGSLQFSRGCPFQCEFCDIIVTFGRKPRLKTSAQVIAELQALRAQKIDIAFIVDDNLIGNKKAIKLILRDIIAWQETRGYPLSFVTEASIDLAEDDEMMRLMLDANIDSVFVGIESPNEEALRETKKIQNLTDRSGTALEKIHRIQEAGIFVWGGTIIGFDHDDESVFELHREFVAQSRIAQMIVQVLYAIPQTPLHKRLAAEGRLDDGFVMANWGAAAATNVVPLRLSMAALREGYLKLISDLYTPDAFFARMDAMCLGTKWLPAPGRTKHLRRHRLRWLKLRAWAGIQTLYIFVQLMRVVPDAELRRQYRRRIWLAMKRRPNIRLIRIYCMTCAAHFHYDRLIAQMTATPPFVASAPAPSQPAADARAAAD